MKRIVVTSSVCFAFFVMACSSSNSNPTQPSGNVGGSSTSSAKGGQTSSTTNSSGPVGGSSATTTSNPGSGGSTGTSGNTAASGGSTATSGNTASGGSTATSGSTGAKGGATGTTGTTGAKGGSTGTGAGGNTATSNTSNVGGSSNTSVGGTEAKGGSGNAGAGPKGGSSAGGSSAIPAGGNDGSGVTVQLDKEQQKIQGFGINDTWASEAIPAKLFSTTDADGLGLSILRVGMGDNGSDFSTNISGDITIAKNAGAKIIGSCWSPPADCKTSGTVNDGGHLKSGDCYKTWSDTIVKWATAKGLYAMSIGNEPDFASCGTTEPCNGNYATTVYTAKEMVEWVKVAGPKLQQAGIKVIAPEASEWIHNWSNISATGSEPGKKNSSDPLKCGCFGNTIDAATEAKCTAACQGGDGYDYGHWLAKDEKAWAAFDIMGVHEYDTQKAEVWPADVTEGKVTKEIWQTEMSGVKWWPEQGTINGTNVTGTTTIENGVAVAGWIHSALVVGKASAWLYWWYKPLGTDDNEGLLVKSGGVAKRYYTFGNYSRYVRPGQVMVDVTGNTSSTVLISAFKGSDGTVVVVAINKATAAATVPIKITGGTAPAKCTPNVTSSADNLKAGTAVNVTDGSFSAALGAMSVTTFVCK